MSKKNVVWMKELPFTIQEAIQAFLDENPGTFQDHQPFDARDVWELKDALDAYLRWEGIIGYTGEIMSFFDVAAEE